MSKRGAIDPCFPSKIGIPHVHNLLYKHHAKRPLDVIFFPMIDALGTFLSNTGLAVAEQQASALAMVERARQIGLNALILQVQDPVRAGDRFTQP